MKCDIHGKVGEFCHYCNPSGFVLRRIGILLADGAFAAQHHTWHGVDRVVDRTRFLKAGHWPTSEQALDAISRCTDREDFEAEEMQIAALDIANALDGDWQSPALIERPPGKGSFFCLVLLDDGSRHVGNFHANVSAIGGQFAFDQPNVIGWQPLPPIFK